LAFLARDSVVNNGLISATAAGFRGGIFVNDDRPGQILGFTAMDELPIDGGQKGEGISTSRYGPAFAGRGNVANGGGGGDCHNSGGGGGGNGGSGGQGGFSWSVDQSRDVGGLGGGSLRYSLADHLTLGGGGGAGHGNDNAQSSGGRGGGAIFIRGGSMPDGGVIAANGQNAPNALANDGVGGGGGGGTIYLRFAGPVACSSVTASGGNGGSVAVAQHGPGGGGAGGRIILQGTDTTGCPASVLSGIAGTQSDPNAPGGRRYGAQPSENDLPGYVGTVDTLPGPFTLTPPGPGGPNAPYLAGSCGCRAGPIGAVGAILPLLSIAAVLLLRRRRRKA
jgi:MYXO-CTERM domain-containing protein